MATNQLDIHENMVEILLTKAEEERFPSSTMLDLIEELMNDDQADRYARMLLERIEDERFPSIPVLGRLKRLGYAF